MKKLLIMLLVLVSMAFTASDKECPEDYCPIEYKETLYCFGAKCLTVDVYQCTCDEEHLYVYFK